MPELTGREELNQASKLTMKDKLIALRFSELLDAGYIWRWN
jgi:hypothetical protein